MQSNLANEVLHGIRLATIDERLATTPSRYDQLPPITSHADRDANVMTTGAEVHPVVGRTNANGVNNASTTVSSLNANNHNNNSNAHVSQIPYSQLILDVLRFLCQLLSK